MNGPPMWTHAPILLLYRSFLLFNSAEMTHHLTAILSCAPQPDRMLDLGFDEEVQAIVSHFRQQRQTLF